MDRIIFCKSSFFFIHDITFQGMFPMPQTLRPNTCNSCSEVNLTKISFGNGGHSFAIIISLSHLLNNFDTSITNILFIISPLHGHGISQDINVHFNTILMLRTSFKSWRPPKFGLFYHWAMHLFQMFGWQPFCNIRWKVWVIIKLKYFYTIFFSTFNLIYVNFKTI